MTSIFCQVFVLTCCPEVSSLRKAMDSSWFPLLVSARRHGSLASNRFSRKLTARRAFSCTGRKWAALPVLCTFGPSPPPKLSWPLAKPSNSVITERTQIFLFKSHKLEVDLSQLSYQAFFYQWAAPRLCRFHTEAVSSAPPSDQWIRWCPEPETEAALPAPPAPLSAGPPAAHTHTRMHTIKQSDSFDVRKKGDKKTSRIFLLWTHQEVYLDFILAFLLLRQLVCKGVAPRLQLPDIVLAVSRLLLRLLFFLWRRERWFCLDDDIVTLPDNTRTQMRCYRYLCFTAFACLFTSGIYTIYEKENSCISSKNILKC